MHELSIAHAVVSTVIGALPEGTASVQQVRLRVGELSTVVPSALEFAYEVAVEGTVLAGSTLVIERAPIVIDCPACGRCELADAREFRCPTCGEPCGIVVGGQELDIVDVTLTGPPDAPAPDPALDRIRAGVLAGNDLLAAGLRDRFAAAGLPVSNWVSSPGPGKTALLEAVLTLAAERGMAAAALVGDCATDNDARRLARSGAATRQIVTDGMCHLEADLVSAHLEGWDLAALDLLVIENVGNLVCPTGFDLGEGTRVALLSVTEGEDKPLKYPQIFHSADVVVVTKTDLAQAVEWQRDATLDAIAAVNPEALVLLTSARTGDGVAALLDILSAPPGSAPDLVLDGSRLQEAP
jgi:hydrogenase nickel incorporation protein HypB